MQEQAQKQRMLLAQKEAEPATLLAHEEAARNLQLDLEEGQYLAAIAARADDGGRQLITDAVESALD